MRITPKRWSVDTIMCGMRGHVAPAAMVADIRPQDEALGRLVSSGGRLCRCVRCDTWVGYDDPHQASSEHLPAEADLPKPLRGRALNERITIRGIAILAWLNAALFTLVSVLLLVLLLGLPEIQSFASAELQQLQSIITQYRPTDSFVPKWEQRIDELQRWEFGVLLGLAAGYAALQAVEAFYLWRGRRWAEYLTAIESSLFLPYLVYNVIAEPSALHVGSLVVQLAIIGYLVLAKRLFGVRGGYRRLQQIYGAEMDWPRIYEHPPLREPPTEAQMQRAIRP